VKFLEDFGNDWLGRNKLSKCGIGRGNIFEDVLLESTKFLGGLCADGEALFSAFFFLLYLLLLSCITNS
jgi:hypothetical protein